MVRACARKRLRSLRNVGRTKVVTKAKDYLWVQHVGPKDNSNSKAGNFYGVPWNFYGVLWNFYGVPWNFCTMPLKRKRIQ